MDIPSIADVDRQIADYTEASLERLVSYGDNLAARWEHLTNDQRLARRAANELARRRMQADAASAQQAQERRAATNRAAFDAQRQALADGLEQKRREYGPSI